MTVRGPIAAEQFGKVLAHEHIMVDFIGADKVSPDRYDPGAVTERMRPFLDDLRGRGYRGFVEATPAWIGRDVALLRQLADQTDMHILTNTGIYGAAKDKFVPAFAYEQSAEQLAASYIREWQDGIDSTGIKPGFIKTAVDPGPLSDIDRKLVRAAARASKATGLTIACHTGEAEAALAVVDEVTSAGVRPDKLIIVHADSIADRQVHLQLARTGAWIEYDHITDTSTEKHVELIQMIIDAGFVGQLLLSHDAGWYHVGEPNGGNVRHYNSLHDKLVPALLNAGATKETIHQLLVTNPARAFAITP